ncbi:MAG TPA: substrate-binding domain-containing protein, partial [Polyangiaceae bacterium]|nr:substrate-binding domain-containing protein [Polyangiaceae bacterium]
LRDSGLYAALAPVFEREAGQTLTPTFSGTGEALALARAGQADVVWVHSRAAEDAFVSEGYGLNRRDVMHSEYVIVGPPSDPAQVEGIVSSVDALTKIARGGGAFVSRGDDSGNHAREQDLWRLTGIEPAEPWYTVLHTGMLPTLVHASERGTYALTDVATYLVNRERLQLKVLVRGDARLENRYAVIAVNPAKLNGINYEGAMAFIGFVTSDAARTIIADFGRREYGTPLFVPSREASSAQ